MVSTLYFQLVAVIKMNTIPKLGQYLSPIPPMGSVSEEKKLKTLGIDEHDDDD